VKAFVSGLLLCLVFVLFQSEAAEARRRHHVRHIHGTHYGLHVHKAQYKLRKKPRVRTMVAPSFEKDVCLFLCQGGLPSDVATYGAPSPWRAMQRKNAVTYRPALDVGPRPRAWCGWWLQTYTGVTSATTHLNLNRAIEWAQVGRATSPKIGAIVVWRHHVGKITGVAANGRYLVMSGNSGGHRGARTVTERPRSLRGAVAFRSLY
jgi:hypothetical protein